MKRLDAKLTPKRVCIPAVVAILPALIIRPASADETFTCPMMLPSSDDSVLLVGLVLVHFQLQMRLKAT